MTDLLASLWLREPDAPTIGRAHRELGMPLANPAELGLAYTDIFILNIPPYGSVFTDDFGELNGPSAERLGESFDQVGFQPVELHQVAAPDHVGLLLRYREVRGSYPPEHDPSWIHLCCVAVAREPEVHPLYAALAEHTRQIVPPFRQEQADLRSPLELRSDEDEVTLGRIVRYFLVPARCGMYLSRSRFGYLAMRLSVRLPFGSRFDVAKSLFQAVGDRFGQLVDLLEEEAGDWAQALGCEPRSAPVLSEMRRLAAS